MQVTVNVTREDIERRKRLGAPMRTLLRTLLICLLAPAAVVLAQDKPSNAVPSQDNLFSTHNKLHYTALKHIVLQAAEKMPEENYNYKPTEVVRGYGQIIGHIADA